ncbi:hypothetical protein AJ80_05443 [Polytolypa hystricis UAMH7299]|uniref:HMG box domain-containing protein n=1 Tax=Polytolypa hystricis (strain UAMH7299) TaxID=1447883 RepID=A0A2B7Y3F2_POLH7|nr:hypothetical protein AJ80_05443 [Polytolypa hystricis UAMH7299]
METHEASSAHNPAPNPPSIEAAYKRKCIELKKRLSEIEAQNDAMRTRNANGIRYIQKMRLESCILLERLSALTGMAAGDQGDAQDPELRARALAIMNQSGTLLDSNNDDGPVAATATAASASAGNSRSAVGGNSGVKRGYNGHEYLDDASEGSSEEHPPTPQERPLRVKRNRKPDDDTATPNNNNNNNNNEHDNGILPDTPDQPSSSTLPPLLPALPSRSEIQPPHDDSRSASIFKPYVPSGTVLIAPNPSSSTRMSGIIHTEPSLSQGRNTTRRSSATYNTPAPGPSSPSGPSPEHQQPQRYISAFEDYTNRTRHIVVDAMVEAYGPDRPITEEEVDQALADHWASLDPEAKREYGDRLRKDGGGSGGGL